MYFCNKSLILFKAIHFSLLIFNLMGSQCSKLDQSHRKKQEIRKNFNLFDFKISKEDMQTLCSTMSCIAISMTTPAIKIQYTCTYIPEVWICKSHLRVGSYCVCELLESESLISRPIINYRLINCAC